MKAPAGLIRDLEDLGLIRQYSHAMRSRGRRTRGGRPKAVALLLGFGVLLLARQAIAAPPTTSPGLLLDLPIDLALRGQSYASTIQPQYSGSYLFEIRYSMDGRRIDSNLTGTPRAFAQPYHEAFGGRVRLEVTERASGRKLAPSEPRWLPIQIATSGQAEVCADRLEFLLERDLTYDVRAVVDESPNFLQATGPRLLVEATNPTQLGLIANLHSITLVMIAVGGLGLITFLAWVRTGKSPKS